MSTYDERMSNPAYRAHVQGIVNQAPPATPEDLAILRSIIRSGRRGAAAQSSTSAGRTA